jgi:hypothetical protein
MVRSVIGPAWQGRGRNVPDGDQTLVWRTSGEGTGDRELAGLRTIVVERSRAFGARCGLISRAIVS